MNYNEAIAYIQSLQKFGSRPGLESIRNLCSALGNPQEKLKFIHVAGTNGKGSTCNFIANIMIEAGHNVGLHTSPYINSYCEMFKINGKMISESDFTRLTESIINTNCLCTEYEFLTAMVFLYFLENSCDYVVIEVGMGGLLDSTNIIPSPEVAVITSISLDHVNVLGSNLEQITAQKCGIIKENCAVVSSKQAEEVRAVIMQHAPHAIFAPNLSLNMTPLYQNENAATAITVAKILNCPEKAISSGLKNIKVPCRFEIIQQSSPTIIHDAAHNESGAIALANSLKSHFPNKKITLVMGMLSDKDYESCVKILAPISHEFIVITPDSPRALPAEKLLKIAKKHCSNARIGNAKERYEKAEVVCLCGSFTLFKKKSKKQ